jgi:hypothetical protein
VTPLLNQLLAVPFVQRDAWVDRMLGITELPSDGPDLPTGSVPYLPCGVEEILAMVQELPLRADDELVDIGSGVGRVVILAHLLTGARAHGIEIQAALVRLARQHASGLESVSFVHANAADVELDGSVFFLYSPFGGAPLARLLERLESVAQRRPISICAVGMELRDLKWLKRRDTSSVSLSIYESVTAGRSATAR